MSTQIVKNPTPPPPPKFIFLVGFIALAAIAYLVSATLTAEHEIEDLQNRLGGEKGRI